MIHQDPRATALLMIEFQREWLDPSAGPLNALMQDRARFEASVPAARRLLNGARRAGMAIVHVPCLFESGYPEIAGSGPAGLFATIPRAGTWTGAGRPFAPGFEPQGGEFTVSGRVGASAFAHSNLDLYLRRRGVTRLLLAGYALHVCVESTLRAAHDLGYDATVVEDACAAFTAAQRDHVLRDVVHHFGRIATVDEVLSPALLAAA